MPIENEISKMEAICSRREYCSSDIAEKLKRRGVSAEDAAKILQSLRQAKFIDDSRYAAAFARDRSSLAGWGPVKIAFQLRRKGITEEMVRAAIGAIDTPKAAARLHEVLLIKWKELRKEQDPQKKRIKALRFAISRGYSFEEAMRVIAGLEKKDKDDNTRAD